MEELYFKVTQSGAGCEKADQCNGASERCRKGVFNEQMICDPKRRWMYCYEYRRKLGLVFDSDIGTYILPETKALLMERAKE